MHRKFLERRHPPHLQRLFSHAFFIDVLLAGYLSYLSDAVRRDDETDDIENENIMDEEEGREKKKTSCYAGCFDAKNFKKFLEEDDS